MGLLTGRRRQSSLKRLVIGRLPLLRLLGPGTTLVGILALLFSLVTGRVDLRTLEQWIGSDRSEQPADSAIQPVNLKNLGQKSADTIRIATFNIKVFGKDKSSNNEVMNAIAQIVAQFDVVAIQEVRGGDAVPIQRLVDKLNASGARYTATVSLPIGRTSQTESYAFVWDENRVQLVPRSDYLVMDTSDRMHREPMVASFQVRTGTSDGRVPFRFTLINAHTSPREVVASAIANEMDVLDDVFVSVRQFDHQQTGEEDFILLGDLNVDPGGLRELGQIPGIVSIAGDIKTNTLRTKTYDHILIDQQTTREFTGRFGVLDLQADFGLSEEQAIQISDHLPLWAEFSAYEMPGFQPVASSNPLPIR
jgi:endonuclease/exonuclease/phosphatase family metal-dependent hydrolase